MAYSRFGKLVAEGFFAGPAGAEVPVIDADGYIVQPEAHTAAVVGATGTAAKMPANPVGYLVIKVGDDLFKVPYFKM